MLTADRVPLRDAIRVWTRIALMSFGGPAGQIAVMHRELVEERRWIGEQRFLHALNYCMLLPGPEAQQLATYIGWLLNGTKGGIIAGGLFILPGVAAIMLLSVLYAAFGNVSAVEALFFGLKAAVLAIVLDAVIRIGRRALNTTLLRIVAAAAFVAIFIFAVPFPLIILAAGSIGLVAGRIAQPSAHSHARPVVEGSAAILGDPFDDPADGPRRPLLVPLVFAALWLAPVAALLATLGRGNVFTEIALFFSRMAVVTFGGAYAVLAYVAQQAVGHFHWLSAPEMLDGLGMAETTPGPLIMVTQFVGFMGAFRDAGGLKPMVAGALGGLLATWVTFMPCFLWIFLGAPYVERLRGNRALGRILSTITAAVVGVILNLAMWFAVHSLFGRVVEVRRGPFEFDSPVLASVDPAAGLLAAAAIAAILRFRLSPALVLAGCAAVGLALTLVGLR